MALPKTTQEGLTDRIILEAKQFAFYNYCSAAFNQEANFEDMDTWPFAASVAYYAISNYMSGNKSCWPYGNNTIPMDLKDAAFETALAEWKGAGKEVELYKCPCCNGDGKETCTNPDHGFIEAMPGEIGRLGCPVCGHDPNHKVKNGGQCITCDGAGKVNIEQYNQFCEETGYDKEPELLTKHRNLCCRECGKEVGNEC